MSSSNRIVRSIAVAALAAQSFLACAKNAPDTLTPVDLRTEYLERPIGMDEPKPRFSWKLEGTAKRQTAYKVVVRSQDRDVVWDSGWVESGESVQIEYDGKPLKPFTRYSWSVAVRDENGAASKPRKARFETGFMGTPWSAKWIGSDRHSDILRPVPEFKGAIRVGGDVATARLYVTALGLYKASINGEPVAPENVFTPGWTQYFDRVQYQAYDVTKLIQPGRVNTLSALLSDGWYTGRISRHWNGNRPTFGDQALLKAELHIRLKNGKTQKLVTDESWEWRESDIKMADIYDGVHKLAWKTDAKWLKEPPKKPNVTIFDKNVRIDWQSGAFVRRMHRIKPVEIKKMDNGNWLVDFGQNFAGRERFTLRGAKKGDVITIRHAEMLKDDGTLYTEAMRSARATTVYEASDKPTQVYEPEFTFYGFRYIEIAGWKGRLDKNMIEGISVYSDLEKTGSFQCGVPLLNQFYSCVVWGQRSNFLDVPTDCPQRDERLGWTGDTQVFANVATYNMNCAPFYTKWLADFFLCQAENGGCPSIVPDDRRGAAWARFWGAATGWGDAAIIVPWTMYVKYGDTRLLRNHLDDMIRWFDFQTNLARGGLIVRNAVYGDWLNLNAPISEEYVSTAYLAGMVDRASKIANIIGDKEKEAQLKKRFEDIRAAFQQNFFTPEGDLKQPSQTAALLALEFNLCTEPNRKKMVDALLAELAARDNHLSTGFLGTPLLLKTLTKNGHADRAYDMILTTTYPSWLYPIVNGATTMWERWNSYVKGKGFGDVTMNSFNHYSYGAVADWLFETVAGIQPIPDRPETTAFKRFRLTPIPSEKLGHAAAEYDSAYGKIKSAWKIDGEKLRWTFTVPCNTTAEVVFPTLKRPPKIKGISLQDGKYVAQPGTYAVVLDR